MSATPDPEAAERARIAWRLAQFRGERGPTTPAGEVVATEDVAAAKRAALAAAVRQDALLLTAARTLALIAGRSALAAVPGGPLVREIGAAALEIALSEGQAGVGGW